MKIFSLRRSLSRPNTIVRPLAAVLVLLAGLSIARADDHTFTLKVDTSPTSVAVAGDFNGWNTTANPMTLKDGVYQTTVTLTPGPHQYKFVVDGQWQNDPAADKSLEVADGNGGNNSVVNVGAAAGGATPPASTPPATTPPAAATAADHEFVFTPAAGAAKPNSVNVAGDFNGWNTTANPMTEKDGVFRTTIHLTPGAHQYKLVIDGQWQNDPTADKSLEQPDGQGGANSVVNIGDAAGGAPPAAGTPPAANPPAAGATAADHEFVFTPAAGAAKPNSVAVAGDFNGWNTTANAMTEKDGAFRTTIHLTPGVHQYKLVIDGQWQNDPAADKSLDQPDGLGGKNSAVQIGGAPATPSGPATPPAPDKHTSIDGGSQYTHQFYYVPEAGKPMPRNVYVVGDFNSWNDSATRMNYVDGAFRADVVLQDGVHMYKFKRDGDWINDPRSETALEQDDGFGGKNSAVLAGPDGRSLPPPQPDSINRTALAHSPDDSSDCDVIDGSHVRLSLTTQADDVQTVVAVVSNGNGPTSRTSLYKVSSRVGLDRYAGIVTVPTAGQPANYFFELTDGSAKTFLAASDETTTEQQAAAHPFTASMQVTFETPDWAKHAVWYQIFPERFRNGDPKNDPDESNSEHMVRWTSKWYETQPGEAPGVENFFEGKGNVWKRRYGGDIQGIQQELPYLKSLGITAIYLNPIFEAASMHKYDTTDYRHVDEHFGVKGDWPVAGETADPATWKWSPTDKIFLDFVAEAHRQGFKIVIDGVFNHVGRPNPFFQDVLEHGKNSPYADWFDILDWGDPANWRHFDDPYSVHGHPGGIQWMGWFGNKNSELPIFKKNGETGMGPGPTKLIDDITMRWLAPDGDPSRGVDGFRLDAANDVPHAFWRNWREVVKKTKPDAFIAGEIWDPAQPWINDGKQFDAVMNYQFAMPTLKFFADTHGTSPTVYSQQLTELSYRYPFQSALTMMNLFDSHDTDRLASMFVNPDRNYDSGDRQQDKEGKNYNVSKPSELAYKRMMQAVVVQMSYVGSPMIYYGDENGMWSADDPSDRQPMVWKDLEPFDDPQITFNQPLWDGYQRLIAVHNTRPELQIGFMHIVLVDNATSVMAYARDLDTHHSCVVVNRSDMDRDVTLNFGPTGQDAPLVNWLDGGTIAPPVDAPDSRPQITKDGAAKLTAHDGVVHVTLRPWGSAILSGDWN